MLIQQVIANVINFFNLKLITLDGFVLIRFKVIYAKRITQLTNVFLMVS